MEYCPADSKSKDLVHQPIQQLLWDKENRQTSLNTLYQYAVCQALQSIQWYLTKKQSKKTGARLLRFFTIICVMVAGVIPILSDIMAIDGELSLNPSWASLALIIAASLIGLDRYYGLSNSWMRFLTTEKKISKALQAFQIDWEIYNAELKGYTPDDRQLGDMLAKCQTFLATLNEMIDNEITEWRTQFNESITPVNVPTHNPEEITPTYENK